ncbi:hypothetical protein PsYK624_089670 [Phanerochaete sordida]|uniref:Uncharacterized protein n=1 Tax=Phanerochaete sordida TaxID=48140 RepID=A0A9P3GDL5_9APHY|nr:hypothetical protein PsYK624_089670 [Phanerochaete sordida]
MRLLQRVASAIAAATRKMSFDAIDALAPCTPHKWHILRKVAMGMDAGGLVEEPAEDIAAWAIAFSSGAHVVHTVCQGAPPES